MKAGSFSAIFPLDRLCRGLGHGRYVLTHACLVVQIIKLTQHLYGAVKAFE